MFVFWLADELGLTDPESLISRGAKIFSEVLAREGVIGEEEDCLAPTLLDYVVNKIPEL